MFDFQNGLDIYFLDFFQHNNPLLASLICKSRNLCDKIPLTFNVKSVMTVQK